MIKLENISKKYTAHNKEVVALKDVEIKIKKGFITGIVGVSGAGKSTILDLIAGLIKPENGLINVDGLIINNLNKNELSNYQKRLGIVFQDYNLLENLTVLDNVAMPLKLNGIKKEERIKEALTVLEFIGLSHEKESYPSQLSGGQRQRVAIARAIINKPEILLLDEITSALDQENANIIIKLLLRINQEFNMTILLVSHDLLTIKKICNNVYIIKDGIINDYIEIINNTKISETFDYRNEILGSDYV